MKTKQGWCYTHSKISTHSFVQSSFKKSLYTSRSD